MPPAEKIIFVPFIYAFGGVERLVLALSHYLHEHHCSHSVVCFNQTIDFASYADWPLTVHEIQPRRNPLVEGWALNRYLQAAYAKGSPPALLFDLKGAFYAGMFLPSGFFLHLTDPPSLLPSETSKNAPSARKKYSPCAKAKWPGMIKTARAEIVHRINQRGVRRAASVITMTNSITAELRDLYGVEGQVIRPGVKMPRTQPPLGQLCGNHMRILSVCRLESKKRIEWILRALAELESSTPPLSKRVNWTFEIVGEGSQRENLRSLAKHLGLSERTVFHGRVSDARLEELYLDANLFLMPAVQGYGLPALEALARGIPVVLHRESGVAEILSGTPWVEILDNGSESLSASISRMVGRLINGEFLKHPLPTFPTEADWAQNICRVCRWV